MNTTIIVTTLIATLVGLLLGTVVGYFYKWLLNFKRRETAKQESQIIIERAKNKLNLVTSDDLMKTYPNSKLEDVNIFCKKGPLLEAEKI